MKTFKRFVSFLRLVWLQSLCTPAQAEPVFDAGLFFGEDRATRDAYLAHLETS